MQKLQIRPALVTDAGHVAAIMRTGMSPNVRRITILGSPLLARFVAEQLTQEGGDIYLLALIGEEPAGILSWRLLGKTLVLNHFYVRTEFRGQGLARALLAASREPLAAAGLETVAVDVFSESQTARAWYAALGFHTEYRRLWFEVALPAPRSMSDGQCNVDRLEQADQEHTKFGFSQFKLITFEAEYTIGRLGDAVFRCPGFGILHDRPALAGLAALDSSRTLVCIGAPEDLSSEVRRGGRILEESERLTVPVDQLRKALGISRAG